MKNDATMELAPKKEKLQVPLVASGGWPPKCESQAAVVFSVALLFSESHSRWIPLFDLAQILHHMPFLIQPTHLFGLGTGTRGTPACDSLRQGLCLLLGSNQGSLACKTNMFDSHIKMSNLMAQISTFTVL